ncbi:protein of unknown function [Methylocaldum szegediense]|uniref:Transposase n=1 Tax=Methylocaldum szegediense TaxID=73780 RepID=A0ABN8X1E4_9GAMM|nr:protein of unknown function [Methylocaldum szegediense]
MVWLVTSGFESRPDQEGIKTHFHRFFVGFRRLNRDLIKKGLRRLAEGIRGVLVPFESRPDQEGIKTG